MEAVPRGRKVHFGDLQKEAKTLCLPPAKCASVRGGDPQGSAGHRLWALRSVSRPPGSGVYACPQQSLPPSPPSYSPLNLLSWYQVNAPLLDSTQIPPVLQKPAPVLPPVTAAPVSDVKRNLYCHSYHPFTLFPASDTLVVFLPEPQPTPASWHSPDLHALISLNKFKSCCSRALKM